MHERALRKVLLIQAIEETDRSGEALPLPERTEATRKVMGNNPPNVEAQAGAPLSSATEWFLVRRADALLDALRARSPGIDHVLHVAGGATSLDRGMLVLGFALGAGISFFDGARGGINIFAAPLIVLLVWNLLVYVFAGIRASKSRIETTVFNRGSIDAGGDPRVIGRTGGSRSGDGGPVATGGGDASAPGVNSATAGASAARSEGLAAGSSVSRSAGSAVTASGSAVDGGISPSAVGMSPARSSWFGRFYARGVRRQMDRLLGHSTRFNAPLAPGLRRFAGDWLELAQPLFFARARRLLHLSAVFTALGLVAAYYVRGFALRSAAGWEGGGAIGPETAHALLTVLYGPASLLSGISIPDADGIAKLRWSAPSLSGVGEPAAWVHLIALTAGLYIILPRLILTLLAALRLWRVSRRLVLPPSVVGYLRTLVATARSGG